MKSWIALLGSCFFTSVSFAGLTCGYLNVSITNASDQDCTLRQSIIYNGNLGNVPVPTTIPSGQTALTFTIQQGFSSGPSFMLSYLCGSKSIAFVTEQNFCFLQGGEILGQTQLAQNMKASYSAIPGSFWPGLPGQINWTLS